MELQKMFIKSSTGFVISTVTLLNLLEPTSTPTLAFNMRFRRPTIRAQLQP